MGTGVIGGMLAASVIAIFLIPSGFCLVERVAALIRRTDPATPGLRQRQKARDK